MHYSVIIIGAGMAGIKTAGDLYKAGEKNTLILEARDRLGGRLKSEKATLNPKVSYDFGASWFHDGLQNPLFEKAKTLGNVNYFYDDGKYKYVSEDCKEVPAWDYERIIKDVDTFGQIYFQDPNHEDISVRELCSIYLEKHKSELTETQLKYAQQVVRLWLELWDGISWEYASAKHAFLWGVEHVGRNAYVKNGYRTVYQNELDELPQKYQKHNILLNTQVAHIDYSDKSSVTVTTSAGAVFTADYLVVTAPMSVLRIDDASDAQFIRWSPPLPARIANMMPGCEYGSLGKVVFEFERCFWPEDVHRFYVLASELSAEGSARPWQNPTLIVNYKAMSNVSSLVCLTQDPVSKQIERMSPNEIWQLFEPIISQFATGKVEKPFNVLKTEWNNDPWIRGSYSAGRIGTQMTDDICAIMANGVSNRVRFAGAETMEGPSNGCAHGAFYSGEREARFILKHKKVNAKI
ncbi:hypothetical protein OXX79_006453 [Metschnikowia pulcherrima]